MKFLSKLFYNWSVKLYNDLDFIKLGITATGSIDNNGKYDIMYHVADVKSKWKPILDKANEIAPRYRPQDESKITK